MRLDMHSLTGTDTASSVSWRAQAACARAKELEEAGEFEKARKAIGDFWQRIGDAPRVEGLSNIARAEVLLRAGALSGWIGSAGQITGAQEIAKDLISKSAGEFAKLDWLSVSPKRVSTHRFVTGAKVRLKKLE